VVLGDLNLTDRGRGYHQVLGQAHLVDAMRASGTGFSSIGKWTPLLLRIDHVLVSGGPAGPGWCGDDAHQLELPRSDHRAVAATVGPCAEP